MVWWTGTGAVTTAANQWNGMLGSLTLTGGGILLAPVGHFEVPGNHAVPDSSTIRGAGRFPDGTIGTVFELASGGQAVFTVVGGQRSIHFEDFCCDLSTETSGVGIKVSGTSGTATFQVGFDRVSFFRGTVGVDVVDSDASSPEIVGLKITHCDFLYQTVASIRCGTVNNSFYLEQNFMAPDSNGVADAFQANHAGAVVAVNNTIEGTNATPNTYTGNITAVSTTNDTVTVPSHPFTNGEAVRLYTTGSLPGGLVTGTVYFTRSIDANTISLHGSASEAQSDTNRINITSSGSGTNTIRDLLAIHTRFLPGDVNISNGRIIVGGHGLPSNTTSAVLLGSDGTLPAGLAADTVYYAHYIDSSTVTLHRNAADGNSGSNQIIPTLQGTGVHTLYTTLPITEGRPRAVFNFLGTLSAPPTHSNITLIGNQAEGLPYFLLVQNVFDYQYPITMIGNATQGLIKLKSSCTVVSIGNNLFSRGIEDEYGAAVRLFGFGDQVASVDAGGTANVTTLQRSYQWLSTDSKFNPQDVELPDGYFLKSALSRSRIGFHEDGTQNAIRFTPNSPADLSSPGYFKAFNDTNLSNEDLFVQFVPASGGDSRFDSWVGDMVFSVSNGGGRFEGFRLDGGGNPILAKPFQPSSLADTSANSNTVYYSQTQSKLVYKDSSGVVHVLY